MGEIDVKVQPFSCTTGRGGSTNYPTTRRPETSTPPLAGRPPGEKHRDDTEHDQLPFVGPMVSNADAIANKRDRSRHLPEAQANVQQNNATWQQEITPRRKGNAFSAYGPLYRDRRLDGLSAAQLGYLMTMWSWLGDDDARVSLPPRVIARLFAGDANRQRNIAVLLLRGLLARGPNGSLVPKAEPLPPRAERAAEPVLEPEVSDAETEVSSAEIESVTESVTESVMHSTPEIVDESPAQSVLLRSEICSLISSSSKKSSASAQVSKPPREPRKPRREPRPPTPQQLAFERVRASVERAYRDARRPPPLASASLFGKVASWLVEHNITDAQLASSLGRFLEDPYWVPKGCPAQSWARDPAKYVPPEAPKQYGVVDY